MLASLFIFFSKKDLQGIGRLCATSTDMHKSLYQSDSLWISLAQREEVKLTPDSSPLEQMKGVLLLFADKNKVYKVSIPRLIHFRDNPRFSLKAGNFAYKNRQIGEDHLDWLARFDKDAYVTFKFNEAPAPDPIYPSSFRASACITYDEALTNALKFNTSEYEEAFRMSFETNGKIVSNHIEIIPITNNPEIAPGPYNNPELVPGPTGME